MKVLPVNLTVSRSEFHRLSRETEKAWVPDFVFTLGTESEFELDEQSYL